MQQVSSFLIRTDSFIDGKWVGADSGATFVVVNPANESVIAHVANCGVVETERAIQSASLAQPLWAQRTAKERSYLLRKWFDLILQYQDELARLLTLEQGKPIAEAKGEIAYGASYIEWFAEEAKRVYGDLIPSPVSHKRISVIKQPVGVVGVITPWNFPNAMLARKLAPALAAGCTLVVKPAEQTPLSALALAVLAEKAGIPAGVINIVTSTQAEAIGELITSHPKIRKISFTGSTAVGKRLMAQSASTLKRLSLELGGNAPFIVFDDADLDAAVQGAIASKFRNAGQTCICANRFYVHRQIAEQFTSTFIHAVSTLSIGNGLDANIALGPLIDARAREKVKSLVDDALQKGARLAFSGEFSSDKGYFYPPQVLTHVPANARLLHEEIFGPVAPIVIFDSEDELIAQLNQSPVGLAAYFYTQSPVRIRKFSEQLEVGMVGINEGLISHEMAPFGGIKASGFGREGSKYGLDDYLQIKYLCEGGLIE